MTAFPELADAGLSDVEAPRVDSCRPHGIPVDRSACPPDDAVTENEAATLGALDSLRAGLVTSAAGEVLRRPRHPLLWWPGDRALEVTS